MTLIKQIKILDDKIKANKSRYDLDRESAQISALSSSKLEKYEYWTCEDLGYKPDIIQKAKLGYSPLIKVFEKGLDESDKKEGLLKRLKDIVGKNGQQLEATKDQGERQLDATKDYSAKKKLEFSDEKNQRGMKLINKIKKVNKGVDYKKLLSVYSNGRLHNFNGFTKNR